MHLTGKPMAHSTVPDDDSRDRMSLKLTPAQQARRMVLWLLESICMGLTPYSFLLMGIVLFSGRVHGRLTFFWEFMKALWSYLSFQEEKSRVLLFYVAWIVTTTVYFGRCVIKGRSPAEEEEEARMRAIPRCPHCHEPLRTEQAKQCFKCGFDWHSSPDGEQASTRDRTDVIQEDQLRDRPT
jgi:hypothetical protein